MTREQTRLLIAIADALCALREQLRVELHAGRGDEQDYQARLAIADAVTGLHEIISRSQQNGFNSPR